MGIFGKRVKYQNFPGVEAIPANRTNIVGEKAYQYHLRRAAQLPQGPDDYLWVALRLEPANPYDREAIRVDWILPDGSGWLTVGYIPRNETSKWRPLVMSAPRGVVWCWPAKLMGGDGPKLFGLYFYG